MFDSDWKRHNLENASKIAYEDSEEKKRGKHKF
jgi:hypothetical protein